MIKRSSTQHDWDEFWRRKQQVDDVYSNVDRIILNLKKVTALKGKRILEVGAGTARDSIQFLNEGAEVYVLDYSPEAMNIIITLNQHRDKKIHPILADAFAIPVPDNTFDIVFHQGLLEHFKNPMDLLKENVRVLKNGGFLLVDVPQKYHIYTLIKHTLILFNKWFAGWETEFTIDQLKKMVEQSDTTVVHRYGYWMRPSLMYRIIREILLTIKIKIPLYPAGIQPIRQLRDCLRNRFTSSQWAFYTFLDIGIIAQKN